jgi:hypothetical protein
MNRGRRKNVPSFLHTPTGVYRSILGARITESGNVFATTEDGDSRERMFLVSTFDGNKVEMDALFETLRAKEVARVKAKNRKEVLEARVRHERAQAESDLEDDREYENSYRDLGEQSTAEYEPDEDDPQPSQESEIISKEDTFGFEPLPEAEEEVEILDE